MRQGKQTVWEASLERPDFPRWLRRLDPALAAEDHNRLYQMFRDRRRNRGGLVKRIWLSLSASLFLPIILIGLMIASCLSLCVAFNRMIAIGVFAGAFSLFILGTIRFRTRGTDTRMPYFAAEVFGVSSVRETVAIELWMAGINGWDVAEAIYLEDRSRFWLPTLAVLLLVFGALLFAVVLPMHGTLSPFCLLALTASIFFIREYCRCAMVMSTSSTRDYVLTPRLNTWAGMAHSIKITDNLFNAIRFIMWGFLWTFVFVLMLILAFMPVLFAEREPSSTHWIVSTAIFLVLWFFFWAARLNSERLYADRLLSTLAKAQQRFDPYMQREVMKDQDWMF